MNYRALNKILYVMFVFVLMAPQKGNSADIPRNPDYFFERAVTGKPTIHDVGERLRIAKGVDPDRIAEFTGIHEAVSFPGDSDPDADDFKEEAYGELRSEIRMTYAEVASARSRIEEVKRSVELLRQMVEIATTQYAAGKLDQSVALKGQMEWERVFDTLLLLEKREKIFSLRLNVLMGAAPEDSVPSLEPLREYSPGFNSNELIEAYKSRRFLALFQQLVRPDSPAASGDDTHGTDSLEVESTVFISVARISLESLYQRARRYRTSLIVKGELAQESRLELYKNGKLEFSTLLEGVVALSELRREYQALLGEAHLLKAKVEYATGVSLE